MRVREGAASKREVVSELVKKRVSIDQRMLIGANEAVEAGQCRKNESCLGGTKKDRLGLAGQEEETSWSIGSRRIDHSIDDGNESCEVSGEGLERCRRPIRDQDESFGPQLLPGRGSQSSSRTARVCPRVSTTSERNGSTHDEEQDSNAPLRRRPVLLLVLRCVCKWPGEQAHSGSPPPALTVSWAATSSGKKGDKAPAIPARIFSRSSRGGEFRSTLN
jgi:hypothetical protein